MQLQMVAVVLFTASDDGVSKFDRSTHPQQNLMEFFIFGFDEPEKLCGNRDDPDDVSEWKGVKCNANGEVEVFKWNNKQQAGTLGCEFLPCSMKKLQMWRNALSGTIQLDDLPGKIEVVHLFNNKLTDNPTKGHLSVVGWTSTQPLGRFGKPPNYFQGENLLGGKTREDIY